MTTNSQLAILIGHAYQGDTNPGGGTLRYNGNSVRYDSARSASIDEVDAVIYRIGEETVIAFAGSNSLSDWIRNLRFLPWNTFYGWTHAGFYKGAKKWFDRYATSINMDAAITITGHSMGAAIACNIAIRFDRIIDMQFITMKPKVRLFAEPRSFFSSSARSYEAADLHKSTISFINRNDPIKYVYPWSRTCVKQVCSGGGSHDIWDYARNLRVKEWG